MFKLHTGIDATHIPYKGIGASFTDMMSGKVQMAFSSIAGALPFTTDNRVRAIATTGAKRSSVYPDLPTVAEAGLAGFEVDLWLCVFAPATLPVPILARLNGELTKALEAADINAALAKAGVARCGTSRRRAPPSCAQSSTSGGRSLPTERSKKTDRGSSRPRRA